MHKVALELKELYRLWVDGGNKDVRGVNIERRAQIDARRNGDMLRGTLRQQ